MIKSTLNIIHSEVFGFAGRGGCSEVGLVLSYEFLELLNVLSVTREVNACFVVTSVETDRRLFADQNIVDFIVIAVEFSDHHSIITFERFSKLIPDGCHLLTVLAPRGVVEHKNVFCDVFKNDWQS